MVHSTRSIWRFSLAMPFLLLGYRSARSTTLQVVSYSCIAIRHWGLLPVG